MRRPAGRFFISREQSNVNVNTQQLRVLRTVFEHIILGVGCNGALRMWRYTFYRVGRLLSHVDG